MSEPLGVIPDSPVYWHLDIFASRAAAETAKGARSAVVDALGKTWLFTVADAAWRPPAGTRVATIGPLVVKAGEPYTALYAEGISRVGDVTPVHHHPGPEAWYTMAGEMCVETPAGTMGRARWRHQHHSRRYARHDPGDGLPDTAFALARAAPVGAPLDGAGRLDPQGALQEVMP